MTTEFAYPDFEIRFISVYSKHISGAFKYTDHDKICWIEIKDILNYNLAGADVQIARELIKRS